MRRLLAAFALLLSWPTHAADWQDSPAVAALFQQAGVSGTFVLYDVGRNVLVGHNPERAETRFIPASTFKIPNTLIGLAAGAAQNVDAVLPYGGKPQPFKQWEQDMGLREAIRISNVPIYQELARRVGLERMRESVARLDYGNGQIGDTVDSFWLVGPLAISAVEQTRFLARLAQNALPFPPAAQRAAREITLLEQGPGWELHAKTGWGDARDPDIGWWVGWVEKAGRIYTFALNIDVLQPADADKRIPLGKASLRALGVL